jgi:ceramide glucosyltransferase
VITWLQLRHLILLLALAPLAYYFLASIAALHFFTKRRQETEGFAPPVSILKPVRGLDPAAYENFASFCNLSYPEYEIIFNVADEHDAAIPVIEKIMRDFPERQIRLLIGAERLGVSNKVNKLSRMVDEAQYEHVVISDSDIRVSDGYLRSVIAPFSNPKIGAVTCLYRGIPNSTIGSEFEAMGNSSDFDAGVISAWQLGMVNFTLGATMATTKRSLRKIGGFENLADQFTDDYELGNRLTALGYKVAISNRPVETIYPAHSLREAFRHQVRWALTIRHSTPAGHLGLIFTQGLFWSILAACVAHSAALAAGYIGGYLLLRGTMAWTVGVWGMKDSFLKKRLWLLPARDAWAFLVLVSSFLTRRIEWRGVEYYIRGKELIPVQPRTARG